MTRAEARKRQNLPFIEGTDTILEPLNISTGSDDQEEPEEPTPEQETDESEETTNE